MLKTTKIIAQFFSGSYDADVDEDEDAEDNDVGNGSECKIKSIKLHNFSSISVIVVFSNIYCCEEIIAVEALATTINRHDCCCSVLIGCDVAFPSIVYLSSYFLLLISFYFLSSILSHSKLSVVD